MSVRCVKCGQSSVGLQTLGCPNNHAGHAACIIPVSGVRRCTSCLCSLADCPAKKFLIGTQPRVRLRCGCVYHEECKRKLKDTCERCGESIRVQSTELLAMLAPTRQRAVPADAASASLDVPPDTFIERLRLHAKGVKIGNDTEEVLEELSRITEIRTEGELKKVMTRIGLSAKSSQNVKDIGLMLFKRCVPSVQTSATAATIITPIYTWSAVLPVLSNESRAWFVNAFMRDYDKTLIWHNQAFALRITDCFSQGPTSLIPFCSGCRDVPAQVLTQIGVSFPAMLQIPNIRNSVETLEQLILLCDNTPFERQVALGMTRSVCLKLIEWFDVHGLPMPETWIANEEAWKRVP